MQITTEFGIGDTVFMNMSMIVEDVVEEIIIKDNGIFYKLVGWNRPISEKYLYHSHLAAESKLNAY